MKKMNIQCTKIDNGLLQLIFKEPELVTYIDVIDHLIILKTNNIFAKIGEIHPDDQFLFNRKFKVKSWKIQNDLLLLTIDFNSYETIYEGIFNESPNTNLGLNE